MNTDPHVAVNRNLDRIANTVLIVSNLSMSSVAAYAIGIPNDENDVRVPDNSALDFDEDVDEAQLYLYDICLKVI